MAQKSHRRETLSNDNEIVAFRRRVNDLIEGSGNSQRATAQAIDRDPRSFGHYCTGPTIPDIDTLVSLSKHFKVTTDYLLGLMEEGRNFTDYIYLDKKTYVNIPLYVFNSGNKQRMKPYDFSNHPANDPEKKFWVLLDNKSYEPRFPYNSYVGIDKSQNSVDEGWYLFNSEGTTEISDGTRSLRYMSRKPFSESVRLSKNPENEAYDEVANDQVTVIGKIVNVCHNLS